MTISQIASYHCPRWNELPSLALYMDQVLIVLSESVGSLVPEGESAATPTMINNYVKIGLISPSEKKKYSREHMSRLIMITLLKRVLTMTEIREIFTLDGTEELYASFCVSLEDRLRETFSGEDEPYRCETKCHPLLNAALRALACKFRFEYLLSEEKMAKKAPQS